MNKLGLYAIIILSFAACRQDVKYDSKVYDIQFLYNPWIKLKFNTGIVEVSVAKYRDKINITESDRKLIKDSFRENGIAELHGEIFVDTNHPVMPPDNFQLKLIKDKKSIADTIISNSAPLAKNDVEKNTEV
ncbi:hypothetical protein [Pedobacter alluvionis]|uniref:Uncharacterized protein n=1 Tax=Pedobacter alluvionis TaxID=475253 RepID=A0A497XVA6_9SPHI|nr:hypothetical protein [Pedobacter alluvionis]RLJ73673.1 hypothetical protein BCL90_3835 [Pedobacter alluvionis]TFB32704.1 hypothetical protein E3V97_01310 [Pedobacter alluvionis]